jgi:hypothetical protein
MSKENSQIKNSITHRKKSVNPEQEKHKISMQLWHPVDGDH